jgi:hypothetical protein
MKAAPMVMADQQTTDAVTGDKQAFVRRYLRITRADTILSKMESTNQHIASYEDEERTDRFKDDISRVHDRRRRSKLIADEAKVDVKATVPG